MVAKSTNKKPRKLPPRYPRDSEILIFGGLDELDLRFEHLDEMVDALLDLPDDLDFEVLVQRWKELTEATLKPFHYFLRKAYLEYERFYQLDGWSIDNDPSLNDDLNDVSDFSWRVREFIDGRLIEVPERVIEGINGKITVPAKLAKLYEPAQHACAEAIYLVLLLTKISTDSNHLKDIDSRLRYWLTRYYAASLEVSIGRSSVFTSGGRSSGAISPFKQYINALYKLQRDGIGANEFQRIVIKECSNRTVHTHKNVSLTRFEDTSDRLFYKVGNKEKSIKMPSITSKYGLTFPKGK